MTIAHTAAPSGAKRAAAGEADRKTICDSVSIKVAACVTLGAAGAKSVQNYPPVGYDPARLELKADQWSNAGFR